MRKFFMAVAAMLAAAPNAANAAAFVNGRFEQSSAVGAPGFTTIAGGDNSSIARWLVAGDGFDPNGSYWQPNAGERSIEMNGSGADRIGQTFDAVAGQTYRVTFALAGSPDGAPAIKTVLTTASGGVVQTSTFDTTDASRATMGWRSYSYRFTAGGAATTLFFASADAGPYGAAFDSVSVTAVPEPAVWAMMLFGFFGLSFAVRRRDALPKARVRFT